MAAGSTRSASRHSPTAASKRRTRSADFHPLLVVFRPAGAKNNQQIKIKYHAAAGESRFLRTSYVMRFFALRAKKRMADEIDSTFSDDQRAVGSCARAARRRYSLVLRLPPQPSARPSPGW